MIVKCTSYCLCRPCPPEPSFTLGCDENHFVLCSQPGGCAHSMCSMQFSLFHVRETEAPPRQHTAPWSSEHPQGTPPDYLKWKEHSQTLWLFKGEASAVYPGLTGSRDMGTLHSLSGLRDIPGKLRGSQKALGSHGEEDGLLAALGLLGRHRGEH